MITEQKIDMHIVNIQGFSLMNDVRFVFKLRKRLIERGQHCVKLPPEILKVFNVCFFDQFVIRREMIINGFNIEIRTVVAVDFIYKSADVIHVRVGKDPCGYMPAVHILFKKRHIFGTAAVNYDRVVFIGNEYKRHHEFAGFGKLI